MAEVVRVSSLSAINDRNRPPEVEVGLIGYHGLKILRI